MVSCFSVSQAWPNWKDMSDLCVQHTGDEEEVEELKMRRRRSKRRRRRKERSPVCSALSCRRYWRQILGRAGACRLLGLGASWQLSSDFSGPRNAGHWVQSRWEEDVQPALCRSLPPLPGQFSKQEGHGPGRSPCALCPVLESVSETLGQGTFRGPKKQSTRPSVQPLQGR